MWGSMAGRRSRLVSSARAALCCLVCGEEFPGPGAFKKHLWTYHWPAADRMFKALLRRHASAWQMLALPEALRHRQAIFSQLTTPGASAIPRGFYRAPSVHFKGADGWPVLGLFTDHDITAPAWIGEYRGRYITEEQMYAKQSGSWAYFMSLWLPDGTLAVLDGASRRHGSFLKYCNTSYAPHDDRHNMDLAQYGAHVIGHVFRDIPADTEIVTSYYEMTGWFIYRLGPNGRAKSWYWNRTSK